MRVTKFHRQMVGTAGAGQSVKTTIVDSAIKFLRLHIFGATNVIEFNSFIQRELLEGNNCSRDKLNNTHKEVLTKLLNHLAHGTELKLTQSDLEIFENIECILKPNLSSADSVLMLYLYITARCCLEDASVEVLTKWRELLLLLEQQMTSSKDPIEKGLVSESTKEYFTKLGKIKRKESGILLNTEVNPLDFVESK